MLAIVRLSCKRCVAVDPSTGYQLYTVKGSYLGYPTPRAPLAPLRLDALTSGGDVEFAFSGQTKFGFVGLRAPEVKMVLMGTRILRIWGE